MEWWVAAFGFVQLATIVAGVYVTLRARAWSLDMEECDRLNDEAYGGLSGRLRALENRRGARPRKEIAQ